MTTKTQSSGHLNQTGQNLGRILVASYFMATSLELISGTDVSVIAKLFLPSPYGDHVGNILVFALSYLVLMGVWLRPAALLLAITVFWSGYIANFTAAANADIASFWRDLALIGALFLTYAHSGPRASRARAAVWWTPAVRRIKPAGHVEPRRVKPLTATRDMVTPLAPRIAARDIAREAVMQDTAKKDAAKQAIAKKKIVTPLEVENIFADFDEAAVG